jgi:anti-anti-sigma factor
MSSFTVSGPQTKDGLDHHVILNGELDAKGALVLERAMSPLIGMKTVNVVLDFGSVTFVSSAGVGMLLGLVSSIRREGGEIVLREVSPEVRSVFSLLNLDDFFNLADAAGNRTHA